MKRKKFHGRVYSMGGVCERSCKRIKNSKADHGQYLWFVKVLKGMIISLAVVYGLQVGVE